MKNIVIVGTGMLSEMLFFYLTTLNKRNIVAFTLDEEYMVDKTFLGLPVVPSNRLKNEYPKNENNLILGIGYSKMNDIRKKFFYQFKQDGYEFETFIHPTAIIASNVKIGEGNIILEDSLVQPFSKIGDCNIIFYKVTVAHHSEIGNFNTLTGHVSITGCINIGDNTFIGNSAIVTNKISVADYTLIGAGACVKKETKPYDVIVPQYSITLEHKNSLNIKIL